MTFVGTTRRKGSSASKKLAMHERQKATYRRGRKGSHCDWTNHRFGRWTAKRLSDRKIAGRSAWFCICDCGSEREVLTCHLVSGRSVSCGCYKDEVSSVRAFKHGYAGKNRSGGMKTEYRIWSLMKGRCENKNLPEYANYGARGIKVCSRWHDDFAAFLADMGPRPSSRHSIDRIDFNGDYEPGNCRWATSKEQANNTRRCIFGTVGGEKMTLTQAVERYAAGRTYKTYRDRVRKGESFEEALRLT